MESVRDSVCNHLDHQAIVADYQLACVSRAASVLARQEVLNGRAKFGIFGDGKEVAQLALAHFFAEGDWRSGYYRDQTLMFALQMSDVRKFFSQLYADSNRQFEPASGGRQMVCHFATDTHDIDGKPLALLERCNSAADLSPVAEGDAPSPEAKAIVGAKLRVHPLPSGEQGLHRTTLMLSSSRCSPRACSTRTSVNIGWSSSSRTYSTGLAWGSSTTTCSSPCW